MRGIEVAAFQGKVGESQHRAGDLGKNGVALFEEGVQSARESIVVELVGRNVAEVLDAVLDRPGRDVDQGGGLVKLERSQRVEMRLRGGASLYATGQEAAEKNGAPRRRV